MTDPPANADAHKIAAQQARFNRSTRDHWEHFASHRERIEQLLIADGLGGRGRLCVLGAGNCNDLDLGRLTATFDEVHLVDLDPAAVAAAVRRQGVAASPRLHVHAPVDLSGVAAVMATWPGRRPGSAEVADCIRRVAAAPPPAVGGPFDVVLSPCVLSQVVGYANDTLGPNHPQLSTLRAALRDRHLRVMAGLVAAGGWGILVTDLASSRSVNGLERARHDDLPDMLRSLVARGRAYSGLDPTSVVRVLRHGAGLAGPSADVRELRPWLWTLGPMKTFLVYAVRFRPPADPPRRGVILF